MPGDTKAFGFSQWCAKAESEKVYMISTHMHKIGHKAWVFMARH